MSRRFYLTISAQLLAPVDRTLMTLVLIVLGLGLAIQYSASEMSIQATLQHGGRIAIGMAALLAIAHVTPRRLQRWTPVLFLVNLLMLIAVLHYGTGGGAQRWLSIGPITLQPSELLKLTLPMAIAYILGRVSPPLPSIHVLLSLVLVAGVAGLVAMQPDLGTAILIFAVGGSVIILAGISRLWLASLTTLAGISLPFVWQYALREYQKERIRVFFNPESDPLGSGYNVIQSKIAVGSGGVYGKGWTHSTQGQFDFLPEHSTDFIFSVYAEEFGLIGVSILITLYIAILWRIVAMSRAGADRQSQLLVGGLGLSFLLHILVNIAMTVGYAPVVGLPLPLLSFGGSSMVSLLIAFGMMMSIRHYARMQLK